MSENSTIKKHLGEIAVGDVLVDVQGQRHTITKIDEIDNGRTIFTDTYPSGRENGPADGYTFADIIFNVVVTEADIARLTEMTLAEIDDDIAHEIVPSTVTCFSDLHDHVDANMYCDGIIDDLSGDDFNTVQCRVDAILHERAEAVSPHITVITSGRLVIGERVEMASSGPGYTATSSGIFASVRASDHNGDLCVYFIDGEMNGHPQSHFGCPASQLDVEANR